ncbi:hypothetical protein GUJ93_ZPchr0002g23068 [Zizania palustris]|uniref:Uncharacterized protein n=1 Tax=Zizania palustris TaxID=103762 RepID=A0A8J5RYA8_ZIZPA|nr:hypothetical protein GUJ93_ZPchr0002g23068 [Zizania palustris]
MDIAPPPRLLHIPSQEMSSASRSLCSLVVVGSGAGRIGEPLIWDGDALMVALVAGDLPRREQRRTRANVARW